MSATDQARLELVGALNLLMRRRAATGDAAEKEQINASIDAINEQLEELGHASLLQAASIVAAAGAELEKVVATARTGAFEAFVSQASRQADRLREIGGKLAARPADAARPVTSAGPAPVRPARRAGGRVKPKAKAKAKTKPKPKRAVRAARKPASSTAARTKRPARKKAAARRRPTRR